MDRKQYFGGSISLRVPGINLDSMIAWKTLGIIAEKYPELNQSSADEKQNNFKIFSENLQGEEQEAVMLREDVLALISSGELNEDVWFLRYFDIFQVIQSQIEISPLGIIHIDCQLIYEYKTCINHGKLVYDLFGKTELMDNMYQGMQIIAYKPAILFFVDADEHIVCTIKFVSKSPNKADRLVKYPEPYEISVTCGIAKTGNYNHKTSIEESMRNVINIARPIFENNFKKYIDEPILSYINNKED